MFVDMEGLADYTESIAKKNLEADGHPPALIAFLDGVPRLFCWPYGERDETLWAAQVMAQTCDCDAIAFISDTYHATAETKKNGEPWGPGEMQQVWKNNTEDKELLTEAMMVMFVDRVGDAAMIDLPYERISPKKVEFGERHIWIEGRKGDEFRVGGYMGDAMRKIMQEPTIIQSVPFDATGIGLTKEQIQTHTLCAGVRVLLEKDFPCMVGIMSDEEKEIFQESMESRGFGVEMMRNKDEQ